MYRWLIVGSAVSVRDAEKTMISGGGMDTVLLQSGSDTMLMVGVLLLLVGGIGVAIWRSNALGDPDKATESANATSGAESPETPRAPQSGVSQSAEQAVSDADCVIELLEEHDGRMKQTHIVEETDWSKSKVSMLLSEMEDDGEISKLRVGRENIVSLSGKEPEAAGSPFEED
jgi:uncharacterized membrane protein